MPNIDLGDVSEATAVATSGDHTCALFASGRVKCWGNNDAGQLGIGSSEPAIDVYSEMGNNLGYAVID